LFQSSQASPFRVLIITGGILGVIALGFAAFRHPFLSLPQGFPDLPRKSPQPSSLGRPQRSTDSKPVLSLPAPVPTKRTSSLVQPLREPSPANSPALPRPLLERQFSRRGQTEPPPRSAPPSPPAPTVSAASDSTLPCEHSSGEVAVNDDNHQSQSAEQALANHDQTASTASHEPDNMPHLDQGLSAHHPTDIAVDSQAFAAPSDPSKNTELLLFNNVIPSKPCLLKRQPAGKN
jgi:hypothetical protein